MTTVASPTSATTSRIATLSTPSSSVAPVPVASLVSGTPNSISPPTPACTASAAALRSESRECCTTPGIDAIGAGSASPSRTKSGSTRSPGDSRVCATSARSAAVRRSRRGRPAGNCASGPVPVGIVRWPSGGPSGASATGRSTGSPAATAADRAERAVLRERRGELGHRRVRGEDVDPQAVLLRRLGGGRADAGDHRRGVRLAGDADQVAHRGRRGEDHRVVAAGLDRLADRGGRRRGAHRAVGRDVVDLPAALDQAGDQVLGRDVGARQEDPVDRVEDRRRRAASPPADRRPTARRWAPGRA